MELFLKKHKDLLKIIEKEKHKRHSNEKAYYDNYEKCDIYTLDEDMIDIIIHRLKLTEVERDVHNNRTMITETVLPILDKVDLNHVLKTFVSF